VQGSPAAWARAVIAAYHTHYADKIIAERNNGGEMVEQTIRSTDGGKQLPIRAVWASRGKQTRAEPVSALYEQGRVHHVGAFGTLEDQLCSWLPGMQSPDRLDALVWALSALFRVDHDAPAAAPARTRNAEMF
jgi:phage terminase large subunit-like protein